MTSKTKETIMWVEVDSEAGTDTEGEGEEGEGEFDEGAHLMGKPALSNFQDLNYQDLITKTDTLEQRNVASLKLNTKEEIYYSLIILFLFFVNMAAASLSLFFRHEALVLNENCDRPLAEYLFYSAMHGFSNGFLLLVYLTVLCKNMHSGVANFNFFETSVDRPLMGTLETLLLALGLTQIGLGILAEIWVGQLGLFPGQASTCRLTAPLLFHATTYLGLYQDYLIVMLALYLLLRAIIVSMKQ